MKPVLLSFGRFHLYGYGTMIVLGGALAVWLLRRRAAGLGLKSSEDFWLLVNVVLLSGFAGGRLLFLVEYTRPFSPEFWRILVSPSTGFSVLGAFLSMPLAVWLFCRRVGAPFGRVMDHLLAVAPIWHAIGRLGCLLAGCCHGRPTSMPWGIVFRDPRSLVRPEWLGVPLHPTQLYEAAGNLLIGVVLLRLLDRESEPPGLVSACYLGAYGALRFVEEFYRGDTVAFVFGLTAGQGLSLGLLAASAALLIRRSRCIRRS